MPALSRDESEQFSGVDWLFQKAYSAAAHSSRFGPGVGKGGHDAYRRAPLLDQGLQKLQAASARHFEIGEYTMHFAHITRGEEFVRGTVCLAANAYSLEEVVERLQQKVIIINYGDRGGGLETH